MSAARECKFCKLEVDPVECGDSDVCESCWYGMRLEPEEFEARMARLGVQLADGGHGFQAIDDGSIVHLNRDPFRLASEPAPDNAGIAAWIAEAVGLRKEKAK